MRYEFLVRGWVSEAVEAALPEMSATACATGVMSLFGPIRDEADAFTMLGRVGDLGLSVIEMRRLPDQRAPPPHQPRSPRAVKR